MSENEFADAVFRKAVLEMLRIHNFSTTRESCVNVLVDVLRSFVYNIGYGSVSFSGLCGRTEQNTIDVKQSLNSNKISFHELRKYLRLINQKDIKKQKKSQHTQKAPQFMINIPHFPVNVKSDFLTNPIVLPPPLPSSATTSTPQIATEPNNQEKNVGEGGEEKDDEDGKNESMKIRESEEEEIVDEVEELPFLPPFPPEYTYKFTNREFLKERKEKEWNQVLAGERKEVEKSLTRIHRSELERYSRNNQYFGKDDWFGGGKAGRGDGEEGGVGGGGGGRVNRRREEEEEEEEERERKEKEEENNKVEEEEEEGAGGGMDDVLVNPYIVISSRKQGLFRGTIVEESDGNVVRGEKRLLPENLKARDNVKSKKRRRPVIVDDSERQRIKRFRVDKDSHFSQTAHDLLVRTQTYVKEKGKKK